jgi:hypothetical protein
MLLEVTRCGEFESEVHSPRIPIGRQGTNENRVRWKHVFLMYLDVGNMSPVPKHLKNRLVDRGPREIEFVEKFLPSLD